MNDDYEVLCDDCGWYGYLEDLTSGITCPDCGSDDIVGYEGDEEE